MDTLVRLTGAVIREQDEIWQESRYISKVRINELYDDGRTRRIDGPVEWARLEAETRKMLESGLELADRVETAWDINRIPDSRTLVRLASDQTLNQLSRHYRRYGPHNIRIYILPRSDASQVCLTYLQSRYVTSGFLQAALPFKNEAPSLVYPLNRQTKRPERQSNARVWEHQLRSAGHLYPSVLNRAMLFAYAGKCILSRDEHLTKFTPVHINHARHEHDLERNKL